MTEDDGNVRWPTAGGQSGAIKFPLNSWSLFQQGETTMPLSALQGPKASAYDVHGRLLVYAAPITAGFHGAPLFLSTGQTSRRIKPGQRKNWAKRRAYGA
jgi:hypothetical protein